MSGIGQALRLRSGQALRDMGERLRGLGTVLLQGPRIRTPTARRRLWRMMQENFAGDVEGLFRRYYGNEINLRQLQRRFNRMVKDLHVSQAAIGAGGFENMTPQLWGRIGPVMRRQYQHSRRFMLDLFQRAMFDGKPPSFEYVMWRARLYAGVSEGSGRWVELLSQGEPDDLMVWRRYLSDSCPTCMERDGLEVRRADITFVPRDGSSECLGYCGCEWEEVGSATGGLLSIRAGRIWLGGVELSSSVKKVLKVRKYKAGYEVRTEIIDGSDFGCDDFEMKSAYTPSGDYIGDPKMAYRLCKKRGIAPEKAHSDDSVCSIGFAEKEQAWYGWSHRAIYGFKVGHTVKRGDVGYRASDPKELYQNLLEIHDESDLELLKDGVRVRYGYPDGECEYEVVKVGRGEWTAKTLEDCKKMAIAFAEEIS